MSDEAMVETARGPIPVSAMGTTLMHEHVFITSPEIMQNWPDYPEGFEDEVRIADAIEQLTLAQNSGVQTIVDCTVIGVGRYVPRIQKVAEGVEREHHRRHRRLHLQRRPAVLLLSGSRHHAGRRPR